MRFRTSLQQGPARGPAGSRPPTDFLIEPRTGRLPTPVEEAFEPPHGIVEARERLRFHFLAQPAQEVQEPGRSSRHMRRGAECLRDPLPQHRVDAFQTIEAKKGSQRKESSIPFRYFAAKLPGTRPPGLTAINLWAKTPETAAVRSVATNAQDLITLFISTWISYSERTQPQKSRRPYAAAGIGPRTLYPPGLDSPTDPFVAIIKPVGGRNTRRSGS